MKPRRAISLTVKLAAALLQMKRSDENGNLVPVVSYEEAKTLSAKQIIRRFDFDHWPIPYNGGGPDEPWNLEPKLKADHAIKTTGRKGESRKGDQANGDIQRAAKVKRILAKRISIETDTLEFGTNLHKRPRQKRKIPSRQFPKRGRYERPY